MERRKAAHRNPLINSALVVLVILIVIYIPLRVRMERSERTEMRPPERLTFSIFFTDGLGGRLEPPGNAPGVARGAARWASLIEERRRERPVVVIDAGDFSPLPDAAGPAPDDWRFIEGMRLLPYDAIGIGERETRFGLEDILTNRRSRGLPFVSSNIIDRSTGRPATRTVIVKELGGERSLFGRRGVLRAGIFAVALGEYVFASRQDVSSRYDVVDSKLAALEAVTNLRSAGCGLIVAISHQGWPQSLELARDVRGIDIVLNGHPSHEHALRQIVGRTVVFDAGMAEPALVEVLVTVSGDSVAATLVGVPRQ